LFANLVTRFLQLNSKIRLTFYTSQWLEVVGLGMTTAPKLWIAHTKKRWHTFILGKKTHASKIRW